MNINKFKQDSDKASKGVWCPLDDETRLLIARQGNVEYERFVRSRSKAAVRTIRHMSSVEGEKVIEAITKEATARHVLLGWEGLEEDLDGKLVPITYSPEKALELFNSHPEFYRLVVEFSADFSNYADAEEEATLGNS